MSRLRVAIDARPLQSSPLGGVGRYLAGLVPELSHAVDVVLLLDDRQAQPDIPADGAEPIRLRAPRGLPGLAWLEVAVAPWLRRFDGVFHGAFNVMPMTHRGPSVVTFHDLAPQLHPEDLTLATRLSWRAYMRGAASRARVLTTVSKFSQAQIARHFRLDPGRVSVSSPAVPSTFAAARVGEAGPLIRTLGIDPPYVVAVGGARRRGLATAIAAWRVLRQSTRVSLVVLGEQDLPAADGLHSLRGLDDQRWATVLAGARALCYPTRYEGFGLPALEAAASGTPVVCRPVCSLPEVLGSAGCWVEGDSPEAFAAVLRRLLTDARWQRERRTDGLARAGVFSWAESAAVLLEAYHRAASWRDGLAR